MKQSVYFVTSMGLWSTLGVSIPRHKAAAVGDIVLLALLVRCEKVITTNEAGHVVNKPNNQVECPLLKATPRTKTTLLATPTQITLMYPIAFPLHASP